MRPTEVQAILKYFDIEYRESGPNITDRCVGVTCPFCDDTSFHCGVFKDKGNFTCWRCESRGSLFELIHEIKNISWSQYLEVLNKKLTTSSSKPVERRELSLDCELPPFYEPITESSPEIVLNYLSTRNISLSEASLYRLGFCKYGDYALRLIIPIYFEGKLVAFQARDTTGKSPIRYLTSKNPVNNYFYNYDVQSRQDRLIIVEGVFDVFGMAGKAIASFGTKLTNKQIELIVKKDPTSVVLLWDNSIDDAYVKSLRVVNELRALIPIVYAPKLPKGFDPSKLGYNKCIEIIDSANYLD